MRRSEKEIREKDELEDVLKHGIICRLGLCDNNVPYIVPMNYGYSDGSIYFHSAHSGKKIDLMRKNPNACFEIEVGTELMKSDEACSWGMKYRSIIGHGTIEEIKDLDEKVKGLSLLMKHYSGKAHWNFSEKQIEKVLVLKLTISTMSGKRSG